MYARGSEDLVKTEHKIGLTTNIMIAFPIFFLAFEQLGKIGRGVQGQKFALNGSKRLNPGRWLAR